MKSRSETFMRLLAVGLGAALIVSVSSHPGSAVLADEKQTTGPDGVLTDNSLKKILTDLAYTFTENPGKSGTEFLIKIDRDGIEWGHVMLISANKQNLLIVTGGQDIPASKMASAERFRALLEHNHGMAGHFAIIKKNQGSDYITYINKFVPNRGLTPTAVRKLVDDYDNFMRGTVNLWAAKELWDEKVTTAPNASSAAMQEIAAVAALTGSTSSTLKKKQ